MIFYLLDSFGSHREPSSNCDLDQMMSRDSDRPLPDWPSAANSTKAHAIRPRTMMRGNWPTPTASPSPRPLPRLPVDDTANPSDTTRRCSPVKTRRRRAYPRHISSIPPVHLAPCRTLRPAHLNPQPRHEIPHRTPQTRSPPPTPGTDQGPQRPTRPQSWVNSLTRFCESEYRQTRWGIWALAGPGQVRSRRMGARTGW